MDQPLQLSPGPLYSGSKPVRDPNYLAWLRKLPCSACCSTRSVEAAHTGPHGLSQKASDTDAIPLCRACHRTGMFSLHTLGPVAFAQKHTLDIPALVTKLTKAYNLPNPHREPVACQSCGKPEADLTWLPPSWNYWACESCKLESEIMDYAEAVCPVLYEQVENSKTVAQVVALFKSHATCPACTRKPAAAETAAIDESIRQLAGKVA